MFQVLPEGVAVGSDRDESTLQRLVAEGYRTVLDLCTPSEGKSWVPATVTVAGLGYRNVPVSAQSLDAETLAAFRQVLHESAPPVYVYCASGLRASVFSLLTLAQENGWAAAEFQARLQALGLPEKPDCPLRAFAHRCFSESP